MRRRRHQDYRVRNRLDRSEAEVVPRENRAKWRELEARCWKTGGHLSRCPGILPTAVRSHPARKGPPLDPRPLSLARPRATARRCAGGLRDAVVGPDGALYVATSNRDGRGSPALDDDRILRVVPCWAASRPCLPRARSRSWARAIRSSSASGSSRMCGMAGALALRAATRSRAAGPRRLPASSPSRARS